jgi:hypothetical protein
MTKELAVKGELFLPKNIKPAAVLDCRIAEYRRSGDPHHSIRVLYTYQERPAKGLELHKDVPLQLRLEDGRQAKIIVQHESVTPDGRITGVLRVIGALGEGQWTSERD